MKMNGNDVAWYKSQVVVTVARQIEVPDYEFYMPDELLDKIRDRNKDVFLKLETFFHVYDQWWSYQEENQAEIEADGLREENLTANIELIQKRDATRQDLVDAVKKK